MSRVQRHVDAHHQNSWTRHHSQYMDWGSPQNIIHIQHHPLRQQLGCDDRHSSPHGPHRLWLLSSLFETLIQTFPSLDAWKLKLFTKQSFSVKWCTGCSSQRHNGGTAGRFKRAVWKRGFDFSDFETLPAVRWAVFLYLSLPSEQHLDRVTSPEVSSNLHKLFCFVFLWGGGFT